MTILPRSLTVQDIPAALEICREADWNQTAEDWRMLIELDPKACLALEINRELAATTTLVSYGTKLGWIGMVLTRQRFRRQGCARTLVRSAIELAAARGIRTLKLDATDSGAPLYASLGFADEQPVECWFGGSRLSGQSCIQEATGAIPVEMDTQAFGVDRTAILESLTGRGSLATTDGGYALARAGRAGRYLGPCVASGRIAAERVIERVTGGGGPYYWDLLPGNSAAVELARDFGFNPVRHLRRMSLGERLVGRDHALFALAGFELG